MTQIECFNCHTKWDMATATTSRCPTCGWLHEIYFKKHQAEAASRIYNEYPPKLAKPSGVMPLIGLHGYSVSFPDQDRLADVAGELIDI